jgi:zinc transporter, ZIP family
MLVEPLVTVLIFSSFAALAAAAGVLPRALGAKPSAVTIAWGNALAAGLMLGVAYTLLTVGLRDALAQGGLGALLGIAFVRLTHAVTGTAELDLVLLTEEEQEGEGEKNPGARRPLLRDTAHAAHEGVAIGVAMILSLPLGITMAIALAVHNIPEAMALTSILARGDRSPLRITTLVLATNVNQILFAVLAFVTLATGPVLIPWVTGFAVGALLYLVLAELLPQAYRQAGHTGIALVTLVAMGVLVLLTRGAP